MEKENIIICYFKYFDIKEYFFRQNKLKDKFVVNMKKLKKEWNFFFLVMIDLISVNEKFKRGLLLILVEGFLYVLKIFFDKWLEEGDIN